MSATINIVPSSDDGDGTIDGEGDLQPVSLDLSSEPGLVILNEQTEPSSAFYTALERKYRELSREQQETLHTMFLDTDSRTALKKFQKLESLIFKKAPPNPEQFLNPAYGWFPAQFTESVFPHIKQDFIDILNKTKNYNQVVEYGCTRQGKCEGKDTPILLYDLSVKMIQDIQVGDLLMGDDSLPRKVIRTTSGFGQLYKVKQNKAVDYVVNENHVLTLQYTRWKTKYKNWDKRSEQTIDIPVKDYLALATNKKHKLKGVKASLSFPEKDVEIEPYYLGLWLGDGCNYHASVTTMDQPLVDYIYNYAKVLNLRVSTSNNGSKASSYKICSTKGGNQYVASNNTLFNHLKNTYNLLHNKHIPDDYKKNSRKVRLQVLAGLIDSDGYLEPDKSCYTIAQKNNLLTHDIAFLVRSLGFRCMVRQKKVKGNYYNIIAIYGAKENIPVKLDRKKCDVIGTKNNPLRTGITVENIGEGDFFGFEVNGNGRYLHSDLTITHNSFLATLLIVYTMIYIHYLRDPQLYYRLSPTSSLVIYLLAFKFDKTKQLLLKPIFDIMEISPRFKRVKFQDQVKPQQKEIGLNTIIYSSAATAGEITLASGLQLSMGNTDPLSIIGANVIQMYVSEIAFFIEHAGTTEEEIFRLYTDGLDRIKATVGRSYLAFVYLDTSANNAESIIENYILNDLSNNPQVFYRNRNRWEALPHKFPLWEQTQQTFKVIRGNSQIPAQIVTNQKQLNGVPIDLIINVPVDARPEFERALLKSIKDIAGIPTMPENKWLQDTSVLDDFFDPSLPNIEGIVIADAGDMPDQLIWNQVQDNFFTRVQDVEGAFQIRRAIREPRWIGLDLASSAHGDIAGIACLHKEWSDKDSKVIYVVDFAFTIGPGKTGINLDAISSFIIDLAFRGRLQIIKTYVDRFQSETLRQNLKRNGIPTDINSVDKDIDDYQYMLSALHTRSMLSGRNIFLKNNLEGLRMVRNKQGKEIVDHPPGKTSNKYFEDWNESKCGINAKDCADAVCTALAAARLDDHNPVTIINVENKRFSKNKLDIQDVISKSFASLHRHY